MKAGSLDSVKSLSPLDVLLTPSRDARAADSFAQHLAAPERSSRSAPPSASTTPAAPPAEPTATPAAVETKRSSNNADQQQPSATPSTPEVVAQAKPAEEEEPVDETTAGEETADELALTAVAAPVAPLPEDVPPTPEPAADAEVAAIAEHEGKAPAKKPVDPTQGANQQAPAFEMTDTQEVGTTVNTPGIEEGAAAVPVQASPEVAAEMVTDGAATSEAVASNAALAVAGEGKTTEAKSARVSNKKSTEPGDAEENARGQTLEEEAAAKLKATANEQAAPGAGKVREGRRERGRGDARDAAARLDAAEPTAAAASSTPATAPATASTTTPGNAPLPEVAPPVTDGTAASPLTTTPPPTIAAESPAAQQRLPQHLLARNTQRGSSGAPVTPAEQTRFVQRVAKAFQTAQARGGELQLRLSPAALGSLKLELKVQNGVMEARIEAENATAKAMLVEHLPVLKERLAEQGIVVQKFDVELMDRQQQGQPDTRQDQPAPRGQRGPHAGPSRESEINTTATATTEARSAATDGRLNVTV